ncbi:hypothetical protein MKW98_031139 [Papaver atlanticum]|uniref:Uncharacterized protein n=1 Tax=Papaver atlanticum TaxID=357466 RepID=A0AAD4SXB6_9MAGN|nr:hypothetical protein MKW98_031139 [Papaver atlanticum]
MYALDESDSKGSFLFFRNGYGEIVTAADDEIIEMWKNFSRSAILGYELLHLMAMFVELDNDPPHKVEDEEHRKTLQWS